MEEPLQPMVSAGAYSYLTPAMMAAAIELFDWDHFRFTDNEQKQIDVHTLDTLFTAYYKL